MLKRWLTRFFEREIKQRVKKVGKIGYDRRHKRVIGESSGNEALREERDPLPGHIFSFSTLA